MNKCSYNIPNYFNYKSYNYKYSTHKTILKVCIKYLIFVKFVFVIFYSIHFMVTFIGLTLNETICQGYYL